MARPLRIDFPGAYHHVTTRGILGQGIFPSAGDCAVFLERLAEAHKRWELIIHAYCLMTNHLHLELETPRGELCRAMQWVLQSYAAHVNRKYGRAGHLFQGRYKSILVEADSHLHELTRYIHLNPVKAGLAAHPAEYEWSSYRSYLGLVACPPWLEMSATLGRFGHSRTEQVKRYRQFVESGAGEDPLRNVVHGAVLGSRRFVEQAAQLLAERRGDANVARLDCMRERPTAEAVFTAVARHCRIDTGTLRRKGARRNDARDLAIYLARHRWGIPLGEIGEFVGSLGGAAVSLADRRIAERLPRDAALRKRVAALEEIKV